MFLLFSAADCSYHNLDVDDQELKVLPAAARTIVGESDFLFVFLTVPITRLESHVSRLK